MKTFTALIVVILVITGTLLSLAMIMWAMNSLLLGGHECLGIVAIPYAISGILLTMWIAQKILDDVVTS